MVLQTDSNKSIQPTVIDSDLPCRQCGYNLRGLLCSGVCPECGHAVAGSIPRYLRDSDPTYVRTIGHGALIMVVGMVLSALAGILASLTLPSLYLNLTSNPVSVILAIAPPIVMLVGLWKITSADPRGIDEQRCERLRKIVRATAMIGAISQLLEVATFITFSLPSASARMISWGLIPVGTIALVIGIFATLAYLRTLAYRIPDYVLSRSFGYLRWGFGIPFSLFVLVSACGELFLASTMSADIEDEFMAILTMNTAGLAITALAGLFYILALWRLRRGTFAPPLPASAKI